MGPCLCDLVEFEVCVSMYELVWVVGAVSAGGSSSSAVRLTPQGVAISRWGPILHFSYMRLLHKARTAASSRLLAMEGSSYIVL